MRASARYSNAFQYLTHRCVCTGAPPQGKLANCCSVMTRDRGHDSGGQGGTSPWLLSLSRVLMGESLRLNAIDFQSANA